jgi:hypothetical protein
MDLIIESNSKGEVLDLYECVQFECVGANLLKASQLRIDESGPIKK